MKKLNLFLVFNFFCAVSLQAVTTLNNHDSVAALSVVKIPIDAIAKADMFTAQIFATIDATKTIACSYQNHQYLLQ